MSYGLILVSHSKLLPEGLVNLLKEVAADVPITFVGGLPDGGIGTSFEQNLAIIEANPADELLAFYDLGSAKMNLEMAIDFTDKPIHLFDAAFVEGAYVAAALLQAGANLPEVEAQVNALIVK
jgi:dihydroxyacetone kinase phosphotransfer subunit